MTKEQVIELAKQAGDDWDSTRREDKEFLIRFAKLVRNAALEEAAQICDRFQDRNVGMQPAECAGAIRNLKEQTP